MADSVICILCLHQGNGPWPIPECQCLLSEATVPFEKFLQHVKWDKAQAEIESLRKVAAKEKYDWSYMKIYSEGKAARIEQLLKLHGPAT